MDIINENKENLNYGEDNFQNNTFLDIL